MHNLTKTFMWKKIAAIVAMFAMFATQTAAAIAPETPFTGTGLITKIELSDYSVDFSTQSLRGLVAFSRPVDYTVTVYNAAGTTLIDTVVGGSSAHTTEATTKTFLYDGFNATDTVLPVGTGYQLTVNACTYGTRLPTCDAAHVLFDVVADPVVTLVVITSFTVADSTYNPEEDSSLKFDWTTNVDAADNLYIKNAAGVDVIIPRSFATAKAGTFSWDGKDVTTSKLAVKGTYTATLEATGADGKGNVATKNVTFTVVDDGTSDCNDPSLSGTLIHDLCAEPSTWDPSDEELTIDWEFPKDVDSMLLTAELADGSGDRIELWDDEELDDDDYTYEWNGLDDDDDYIEEGLWAIELNAEKDSDEETLTFYVKVEYSTPTIKSGNLFVSKTEIDNTIGETTSVIFKTESSTEVTVDVVDANGHKVVNLWDEQEVSKKAWYAVEWDGMDDDGDEVDENETYKFRITVANPVNNDVENEYLSETVTVEEDEVSSSRANVTNDFIVPVIVAKNGDYVKVAYKIDEPALMTVEIFKGNKSSNPEIVLENEVSKKAGTYTLSWNGKDEDGKSLDKDAQYSYRVTAQTLDSSKTDKERGKFVVGTEGSYDDNDDDNNDDDNDDNDFGDCDTYFYDVNSSSPYCEAIAWGVENKIVNGYPNGTFKPYDAINRVEALKIALRAFDVPLLTADGTNLGWSDVHFDSWYVSYLRTGKFMGMVNGYKGTTLVKPNEDINRVEFLKYVLEAAEAVNGYRVSKCDSSYYSDAEASKWYGSYVCVAHDYNLYDTDGSYFRPAQSVSRGEVMLLLYRMYQASLIK